MNKRINRTIDFSRNLKSILTAAYHHSGNILENGLILAGLVLTLIVAIGPIDRAGWFIASPSFTLTAILAIVTAFLMTKIHFSTILLHVFSLVAGFLIVLFQGILLTTGPSLMGKITQLIRDFLAVLSGSPTVIHVELIFGYLAWLIGYFSCWRVMQKKDPWVAVGSGLIITLINLNFLKSDHYFYFLLLLISALFLVAITNYFKNRAQLAQRSRPSFKGHLVWIVVAFCFIFVSVFSGWNSSGFKIEKISQWGHSPSPIKSSFINHWINIFSSVSAKESSGATQNNQSEISFGGSLELSDEIIFEIQTDYTGYWKTQVFDYYDSEGWKTGDIEKTVIQSQIPGFKSQQPSNLTQYSVVPAASLTVIPVMGDWLSADTTIIEETFSLQVFEINIFDPSRDILLPMDIARAARLLRSCEPAARLTDEQISALLPEGLQLTSVNRVGPTVRSIAVKRDTRGDQTIVNLSSVNTISSPNQVTVQTEIPPVSTDAELESAGTLYPVWVSDRYLQLPSTLPSRVRELAESIAREAKTPYRQATAIKRYLTQIPYSLNIDPPPGGRDGVDYFLFTAKAGYCTYFASAMAVMLRSIGIPSRLVLGYHPAEYNAENHRYIVRKRDYHAWAEVYFPGYGWLEFDATPGIGANQITAVQENQSLSDTTSALEANSYLKNISDILIYLIIIIFSLLLVSLIIGCFWLFKPPRNIRVLYSKIVILSSLSGFGPKPWQTVLEFTRKLSRNLPEQAATLQEITNIYLSTLYEKEKTADGSQSARDKLALSWPALRTALIKSTLRFKR